jgi:hypothetical protein
MKLEPNYVKQIMQTYIRAVFADRLKQEGFVSRDGEDLHWYRVINGELVQTVYFGTSGRFLALVMDVGYGCHPLFTAPLYPTKIHIPNPLSTAVYFEYPNLKSPNTVFSEECPVHCPADEYKGIDLLEEQVLDKFNQITNLESCYLSHRNKWFGENLEKMWGDQMLTPDFFDEAIYFDDQQVYGRCLLEIERLEEVERSVPKLHHLYQKVMKEIKIQKPVLQGVGRDEYLVELEKRRVKNLKKLEQKVGMSVHYMPH